MKLQKGLLALSVALVMIFSTIAFLIYHIGDNRTDEPVLESFFRDVSSSCSEFDLLSQEEIKELNLSPELGEIQYLIAPNSNEKYTMIGYLSPIEYEGENRIHLYKFPEYDDAIDKGEHVFVATENGERGTALLYAYAGYGSADMFVILFKGAPVNVYRSYADSLITEYESLGFQR